MGKGDRFQEPKFSFGPVDVDQDAWEQAVDPYKPKKAKAVWGWCKDCGFKAYNVSEFTAHIDKCPRNPLR